MSKEAMKLALEGAANYIDALGGDSRKYRQVLANEALNKKAENARELGLDYEPAQPRAWFTIDELNAWADKKLKENPQRAEQPAQPMHPEIKKMYEDYFDKCFRESSIAERTWVGLTNNELQPIADEYRILFGGWVEDFARAIEAKLKEKNT